MRVFCLSVLVAILAAGEASLSAEALAALNQQAKQAGKVENGPAVIGTWIWGGRADAEYRPFFEWDLRLAAGGRAVSDLKVRVATLGPKQEVLREGTWIEIGNLDAGATRDLALRLNCPTFGAWRLEMAWKGGADTWIGTDKQGIPTSLGDLSGSPLLVAVNAQAEPGKKSSLTVTWSLWNLGGVAATGVKQFVKLKNESGKVIVTEEWKGDQQPVAPRSSRECKVVLAKAPEFAGISVEVRSDVPVGSAAVELQAPASTGADLVIEKLRLADGVLSAAVVNRLGKPLPAAVIEVVFSAAGKPVKTIALKISDLAAEAKATVTGPADQLPAWDEYTVSWRPGQ